MGIEQIIGYLIAVAAALAVTARAVGGMASTVKLLNDELQEMANDRREWEHEREQLQARINDLGQQLDTLKCDLVATKKHGEIQIQDLQRETARLHGELSQAKLEIGGLKAENERQR